MIFWTLNSECYFAVIIHLFSTRSLFFGPTQDENFTAKSCVSVSVSVCVCCAVRRRLANVKNLRASKSVNFLLLVVRSNSLPLSFFLTTASSSLVNVRRENPNFVSHESAKSCCMCELLVCCVLAGWLVAAHPKKLKKHTNAFLGQCESSWSSARTHTH